MLLLKCKHTDTVFHDILKLCDGSIFDSNLTVKLEKQERMSAIIYTHQFLSWISPFPLYYTVCWWIHVRITKKHFKKHCHTMLISEIVSMLAMSRLMPTVTGPSGNKEQKTAVSSSLKWGISLHTLRCPHLNISVVQCVLVSFNAHMWARVT